MHKGENVISVALAVVVVLSFVAIQRQWNPASLKDMASTAEDFILSSTGIRGQVPDLVGYERLKTYRLENYRAALYRRTPASLIFAPGRFVIYNRDDRPIFKTETLEGSRDSWTTLWDFNGRHGLTMPGSRSRPEFARSIIGSGLPDVVIGQYSGGDHCCTVATIIELGRDEVSVVGRIDGLDGLPFEGLEIRDIRKDKSWECVAHRPYTTTCGDQAEPADVLSVYAFIDGHYVDNTAQYEDYLAGVLNQKGQQVVLLAGQPQRFGVQQCRLVLEIQVQVLVMVALFVRRGDVKRSHPKSPFKHFAYTDATDDRGRRRFGSCKSFVKGVNRRFQDMLGCLATVRPFHACAGI